MGIAVAFIMAVIVAIGRPAFAESAGTLPAEARPDAESRPPAKDDSAAATPAPPAARPVVPGALPAAAPLGGTICHPTLGPAPAPRWAFLAPGGGKPGEAGTCDPAGWHYVTGGADAILPRPLSEQPFYYALRRDGSTVQVEVLGLAQLGERTRLLAKPVDPPSAPGHSPPDPVRAGDVPDGGEPPPSVTGMVNGQPVPAAPPGPAPGEPPVVALLFNPAAPAAAPAPPDPARISGVVRRRVGRQSLLARGNFVGPGPCWAAVFKRRADAINLALFGPDGSLRLYQSPSWQHGVRAKPLFALPVADLGGPGQDGLLIVGAAADTPSAALLIEFAGRGALRTYAPE